MAKKLLNLIQVIIEVLVAISYAAGFVPFLYLFTGPSAVTLLIVSLILSIVANNKTTKLVVVNLLMSLLSFIPIIGYIPRLIGLILSIVTISSQK